jgi:hypothetical protein
MLAGGLDASLGWILGAIGALIGAVVFSAPSRLPGGWTGLLLVALIAAAAAQVLAPTASFVIAWPLLAAALASGISAAGSARRSLPQLAVMVIAALSLAWIGGLFHLFLQAMDMPMAAAIFVWLAALTIWPLAVSDNPERASLWPAGALLAVSAAVAADLLATSPWTPRHPNAVEPVYMVDPVAKRAWRVSLVKPDAWSKAVLTAEDGGLTRLPSPFARQAFAAASAAPIAVQPPAVSIRAGQDGWVALTASPHPGASGMMITLRAPAGLDQASVNGVSAAFHLDPEQWGRVTWAAPGGFTLRFHTADPAKLDIQTAEVFPQWKSARALAPMPAADQAWDLAGSTFVLGRPTAN